MNDELFIYIRAGIIVLSIGFALWQNFQRRKIEKFVARQALELNRTISIGLGAAQDAIRDLNSGQPPNDHVGRAEGLLNGALIQSIDLYCNLQNPTLDEIEEMVTNDQILPDYKPIFNVFSNSRRGFIRKVLKYISRVY